jgi:hypothetical protein
VSNCTKSGRLVDLHVQPVVDVCEFVSENVTKRHATNLTKICLLENYFNLKLVLLMNMLSLISNVVSTEIIYCTYILNKTIHTTKHKTSL